MSDEPIKSTLSDEDYWLGATMHLLACRKGISECRICKEIEDRYQTEGRVEERDHE